MKNIFYRVVLTCVMAFCSLSSNVFAQKTSNIVTDSVQVKGNCDDCKRRIEKACLRVAGVKKADWNDETQILTLVFDNKKTTVDKIEKSVARFGYDTPHHKGNDKAYKNLPHCCQYREGNPHKSN